MRDGGDEGGEMRQYRRTQAVIPVTIRQLYSAIPAENSDEIFSIDGKEVNLVRYELPPPLPQTCRGEHL
jgi:hypothetical protein